ncbi:MAG TPA: cobyric acid synthase CobQ, partial [Devosia sp.]|nr:cobyric acid synthase CobQ [Devosia sp.]
ISDPDGIEAKAQSIEGLGLLQVETRLTPLKQLRAEQAVDSRHGQPLTGYHMHLGQTWGTDCAVPFARVNGQPEGAVSANGQVMGTYLHGLFASDPFRHAFLRSMAPDIGQGPAHEARIETVLDQLADHLEQHLDLDRLLDLAAAPLSGTPAP